MNARRAHRFAGKTPSKEMVLFCLSRPLKSAKLRKKRRSRESFGETNLKKCDFIEEPDIAFSCMFFMYSGVFGLILRTNQRF